MRCLLPRMSFEHRCSKAGIPWLKKLKTEQAPQLSSVATGARSEHSVAENERAATFVWQFLRSTPWWPFVSLWLLFATTDTPRRAFCGCKYINCHPCGNFLGPPLGGRCGAFTLVKSAPYSHWSIYQAPVCLKL